MTARRNQTPLVEALALLLGIVATFAFALFVLVEWQLLNLDSSTASYYFGFAFVAWGLLLLLIGYWAQRRRRSREERLADTLQFAYARGDLTTEEFEERRERLQFSEGDDRRGEQR